MPRRHHQRNGDASICDILLACLVFYYTFYKWEPNCSGLFNLHINNSYVVLMIFRGFAEAAIDEMPQSKGAAICFLGFMMPALVA